MSERVPHSGATARQRIARETFVKTHDFAARQYLGHDCETLLRYFSKLHLRFAPNLNLNLTLDASYTDEDDADED
jgi:hypothetical protein